jgi:hypothetical protein
LMASLFENRASTSRLFTPFMYSKSVLTSSSERSLKARRLKERNLMAARPETGAYFFLIDLDLVLYSGSASTELFRLAPFLTLIFHRGALLPPSARITTGTASICFHIPYSPDSMLTVVPSRRVSRA